MVGSKLLYFDWLKFSVFWPFFCLFDMHRGTFCITAAPHTFTYNNKYNVHTYNTRIHDGHAAADYSSRASDFGA